MPFGDDEIGERQFKGSHEIRIGEIGVVPPEPRKFVPIDRVRMSYGHGAARVEDDEATVASRHHKVDDRDAAEREEDFLNQPPFE